MNCITQLSKALWLILSSFPFWHSLHRNWREFLRRRMNHDDDDDGNLTTWFALKEFIHFSFLLLLFSEALSVDFALSRRNPMTTNDTAINPIIMICSIFIRFLFLQFSFTVVYYFHFQSHSLMPVFHHLSFQSNFILLLFTNSLLNFLAFTGLFNY